MTQKRKKYPRRVLLKTEVPCLYRSSSTDEYFALLKHEGKQKRVSLKTRDKAEAKRVLADERRKFAKLDGSKSKATLKQLCKTFPG